MEPVTATTAMWGIALLITYWYASRKAGFFLYALVYGKKYDEVESVITRNTYSVPLWGEVVFTIICAACFTDFMATLSDRLIGNKSIEDKALQLRSVIVETKIEAKPEAGGLSLIEGPKEEPFPLILPLIEEEEPKEEVLPPKEKSALQTIWSTPSHGVSDIRFNPFGD